MPEKTGEQPGLFDPIEALGLDKLPTIWPDIIEHVLARKPLCRVFLALTKLQVGYAAEISTETGISKGSLYDYLTALCNLRVLARLRVTSTEMPPLLRRHQQRYFDKRIKGTKMFCKLSWYTINTPDQGGPWTLEQLVALRQAILAKRSG